MEQRREVVVRPGVAFNGVKVFSATMHRDRDQLGETITRWMAERPTVKVTSIVMTQSSDAEFHCLSAVLFYRS